MKFKLPRSCLRRCLRRRAGSQEEACMVRGTRSYGWPATFDDLGTGSRLLMAMLQLGLHYALPYALVSSLFRLLAVAFPWLLAFAIEAVFYLWLTMVKLPSMAAVQLEIESPRPTMLALYKQSTDRVRAADRLGYPWQKWLSGWFLGSGPDEVWWDNVVEWIAAMFYSK